MYCFITLNISKMLPSPPDRQYQPPPGAHNTRHFAAGVLGALGKHDAKRGDNCIESVIFKEQHLCISIDESNIQLACACQGTRGCQHVRRKIATRDIIAALGKSARRPARSRRQVEYAHLFGRLDAINGVLNGVEDSATDLVVGGTAT